MATFSQLEKILASSESSQYVSHDYQYILFKSRNFLTMDQNVLTYSEKCTGFHWRLTRNRENVLGTLLVNSTWPSKKISTV